MATAGGVVVTSSLDYLLPEINRPDLYERANIAELGPRKGPNPDLTILQTIATIILSAFIFIVIVAWFAVLQVYYDTVYVNDIIKSALKSRLVYAITATIITVVVFILFFLIYFLWFRRRRDSDCDDD